MYNLIQINIDYEENTQEIFKLLGEAADQLCRGSSRRVLTLRLTSYP